MISLKRNIIANLAGSGWVALMSFTFIPFYIHFMGIESYGLVGFFMSLQAVLFILDLGLTATAANESICNAKASFKDFSKCSYCDFRHACKLMLNKSASSSTSGESMEAEG